MNAMARNKKWITVTIMATFIWLAHLENAPLPAASASEDRSPQVVENESTPPVIKKKSPWPMVLIGIGAIAALAGVYFLVSKKVKEWVHDDFENSSDALWLPRTASAWSVAGGYYVCQKALAGTDKTQWWEWSLYSRSWSKPNYTIATRMRISDQLGPFGILLVNDPNMESVGGYQILFYGNGLFTVRKVSGWNYKNSTTASYSVIKSWTNSPAITPGLSAWNTYKLVKTGSDYQLFANDTLVYSFSDAASDPRYVALTVHAQTSAMHLEVDSFYVDMN